MGRATARTTRAAASAGRVLIYGSPEAEVGRATFGSTESRTVQIVIDKKTTDPGITLAYDCRRRARNASTCQRGRPGLRESKFRALHSQGATAHL